MWLQLIYDAEVEREMLETSFISDMSKNGKGHSQTPFLLSVENVV